MILINFEYDMKLTIKREHYLIIHNNFFMFCDKCYKQNHEAPMGFDISDLSAELALRPLEEKSF